MELKREVWIELVEGLRAIAACADMARDDTETGKVKALLAVRDDAEKLVKLLVLTK